MTSNESGEQITQQNGERKRYQDKPYNNNRSYNDRNRPYNNENRSNGNYDRKPQYQDKQGGFKSRFGFVYDESKIGFNTEIPEMPEKPKQKPDDARYNKKV